MNRGWGGCSGLGGHFIEILSNLMHLIPEAAKIGGFRRGCNINQPTH
jgi:hypothetical protein